MADINAKLDAELANQNMPFFQRYELGICRKLGLIPWKYVPVELKTERVGRKNDCGVDAMSPDLRTAYQMKCWQHRVKPNDLGSFVVTATLLGVAKKVLITTADMDPVAAERLGIEVINMPNDFAAPSAPIQHAPPAPIGFDETIQFMCDMRDQFAEMKARIADLEAKVAAMSIFQPPPAPTHPVGMIPAPTHPVGTIPAPVQVAAPRARTPQKQADQDDIKKGPSENPWSIYQFWFKAEVDAGRVVFTDDEKKKLALPGGMQKVVSARYRASKQSPDSKN
jgi:hypothetical protein